MNLSPRRNGRDKKCSDEWIGGMWMLKAREEKAQKECSVISGFPTRVDPFLPASLSLLIQSTVGS